MDILYTINNRLFSNTFLLNSLPKAGTNLVKKVIDLFPGVRYSGRSFDRRLNFAKFEAPKSDRNRVIPIGVDWPAEGSRQTIEKSLKKLQKIKGGHYVLGHIPYSQNMEDLLTDMHMKSLLILRDPRDVVVSHMHNISSNPTHFLHEVYQSLSDSEKLLVSIVGFGKDGSAEDGPMLLNIKERYESVTPWRNKEFNYTTYFERLVGSAGGGSNQSQIGEIRNIANHLGIKCSTRQLNSISSQVFGGSLTFRKGKIGGWSDYFSEEHKQVFKDIAGQLLIDEGYEKDLDW